MRHEICQYCGQQFVNEAGYEQHLSATMACLTEKQMRSDSHFERKPNGWWHDAPVIKKKRSVKRPPTIRLFDL